MSFESSVHAKAIDLVKLAIEMTTAAGSGHPTSAASLGHLVAVLVYHHMRFDPIEPDHPDSDRLVLSEGHACPIVYAAAADLGMAIGRDPARRRPMTRDDALRLRAIDSPVDGHPNPAEGFPFFPAATGSLGQGLSMAAGLALAARLDGRPARVFCIVGDGESREGQIAEALDFLVDHQLRAVCPIFNANAFGQADVVSPQQDPDRLAARLEAVGFDAHLIDGHDPAAILRALEVHAATCEMGLSPPVAIVARTVKGWGFQEVIGGAVHGQALNADQQGEAFAALDRCGQTLGARWGEGALVRPPRPQAAAKPAPSPSALPASPLPGFEEALIRFGKGEVLEKKRWAPRRAYGLALRVLGHHDPRIVALDGDVRNSTYSQMFLHDPELRERFFECKIAEQNMVSCAVGLAAGGKIPFVSTFGKFLVRAYDQLEMALISRQPVKLVGSHVGTSAAADGPSQMALADVAFCRALGSVLDDAGRPMMSIFNPADAYAAYAMTLTMAQLPRACYLRTLRSDVPLLYDSRTTFPLGGHHRLAEGRDLLIAATGLMVHEALKAVDALRARGVEPTVVDLYSLPLNAEALLELARENGRRVLTLEDHYGAGFGSAVAEVFSESGEPFHLRQMHVKRVPKSARAPGDLLGFLGLAAEDVVRCVLAEQSTSAR